MGMKIKEHGGATIAKTKAHVPHLEYQIDNRRMHRRTTTCLK
ncbi:MAG: hypothetical protein QXU46_04230 [Candidatus Bathyarchaeia archaeon]